MSKSIHVYTNCEKCEKNYEIELHVSVNSGMKDAIEMVRSGAFMLHKCPHCGQVNFINHSFLFNDLEGDFMVQYATDNDAIYDFIHAHNEMEEKFPNIFNRQKYRLITDTYSKFVEKVEIFKSNLNDKIIELYKYYLASAVERKDFLDIIFEASKDFTQFRFNIIYGENDVERYGFSREFYKELMEKFLEYDWVERNDDLIVDDRLIKNVLKNECNPIPVHVDLYLTKRLHCIKVQVNSKAYWYKTDRIVGLNTKVEVPFGKNSLKGNVIEEKDMSEKELGFTFDKLKEPIKVFYSVDDITNILENGALDATLSGSVLYNADLNLSEKELAYFNEGDVLYYDGTMFAAEKLSKLEKDTRIAVISANPSKLEGFAIANEFSFNVATFIDSYFKVVKKFEYDDKNFIILLHLPKQYWHVLSSNIELRFDKNDFIELAIERLKDKSFIENAKVLTHNLQWEGLCNRYRGEHAKKVNSPVEIV